MNPFTVLKNLSPFHFTSLFSFYFFTYPINPSLHFTLLFISTTHFPSLHFPSLLTWYRLLFRSLVFTFLTLVLKICVIPCEVPIAASSSLFQSVMGLFIKSISRCLLFVFWLWFSNNDRPYSSILAPVTYPLSLCTPCRQYTLCRAHTCVLSSCAGQRFPFWASRMMRKFISFILCTV